MKVAGKLKKCVPMPVFVQFFFSSFPPKLTFLSKPSSSPLPESSSSRPNFKPTKNNQQFQKSPRFQFVRFNGFPSPRSFARGTFAQNKRK